METQLWAIAIKGSSSPAELKNAVGQLANVHSFKVPASGLRVGTLDSLMSLSDDLAKMDILAEATVSKMYKQLLDLKPDEEPTIIGVPVAMYTTMQWEWDEAKFQLKTPLRDLCETISQRISSLDEELKLKVAELNILKASVQGLERKTQGNLMVRGLGDIVREENVMESDYMTTMYVVVPKASTKDFQDSYEKMATYVVPKSGRLLSEDQEYALFAVVIFKKSHDEFKAQCREKRFTLREFTYDPSTLEADRIKKETDSADYERLKSMLANWCHINYAEVYTMMVHMKAVRVFVESVLRFGLSPVGYNRSELVPNFKAFLLQPKKGKAEQLRKAMGALYGGGMGGQENDEEIVVPGATGEFFPYVYASIETEPSVN